MEQQLREFVEQVGLWADGVGMQRSVGRVLGWLLVCDPAEATSQDLVEGLQASAGSVSTALRQLAAAGLVERTAVAGERAAYHRVTPEALTGILEAEVARIATMRELGERGRAAMTEVGADEARRARVDAWTEVATFFQDAWPALLAEWRTRTEGAS